MVADAVPPAVLIVDGDEQVGPADQAFGCRHQDGGGHQPLRDAPVEGVLASVPARRDAHTVVGVLAEKAWRPVGIAVLLQVAYVEHVLLHGRDGPVQKGKVRCVDAAFQRLLVIAFHQALRGVEVLCRQAHEFHLRQRRDALLRAQVGPDDASGFVDRVCLGANVRIAPHRAAGRFTRHVQQLAGDAELPAVVHAAQPAFLVAPEEQLGQAVRAMRVQQADLPAGVPEGDEVLAHQPNPHRRAIRRRQLLAQKRGLPELPEQATHGSAGADAGEDLIVCRIQHV